MPRKRLKASNSADDELSELYLLARTDFLTYCSIMYAAFDVAAHTEYLAGQLQRVAAGAELRLMVSVPPRHGKTLLIQLFCAWYLGRCPQRFVIYTSYSQDLSDDSGRRIRNLIADPRHRAIFPECRLSDDSAAISKFALTAGGAFFAVGRGSSITGRGAHLLICDDLLKDREEANSETIRKNLHEWFKFVAFTRLQPQGAVILVGTRWHEADLQGHLLSERSANWNVVNLPALAEVDDKLGRPEGAALWPAAFPIAVLEATRRVVGSAAFQALYQGRPSALEGNIFKRNWFLTYTQVPADVQAVYLSLDTAFKTGRESDYSVCTIWGVGTSAFYLLHLWRERADFPALKRAVLNLAQQWKPREVYIEDAASGQSLIQDLRQSTRWPVRPVKVDSDKLTRAQACTPLFEAGKVLLPANAPWLGAYCDELASFPGAPHDDCVDSTSQALNQLRAHGDLFK